MKLNLINPNYYQIVNSKFRWIKIELFKFKNRHHRIFKHVKHLCHTRNGNRLSRLIPKCSPNGLKQIKVHHRSQGK